jgi:hypothetical protein
MRDFLIERTKHSNIVLICFHHIQSRPSLPSRFQVEVPKYYPHDRPIVNCLDYKFNTCEYANNIGEICHPDLKEGWSALCSLYTIISTLKSIRDLRSEFMTVETFGEENSMVY